MAKTITAADVKTIILSCEAGVGSSLMSVNSLKRKLKKAEITGVTILHMPAREVPANAALIVVHKSLAAVVRRKAPEAVIVAFNHFIDDPAFEKLVTAFVENGMIESSVE